MKKYPIVLAVSLLGLMHNTSAAFLSQNCDNTVTELLSPGSLSLSLSGLYWRASNIESDYALLNGTYYDINPTYDWGIKAEIAYQFACTANDVKFAVTNFHTTNSDSVSGDVIPTRSNLLSNSPFVAVSPGDISVSGFFTNFGTTAGPVFIIIPGAQLGIFSIPVVPKSISASQGFKNSTWDLDFGKNLRVGNRLQFRFFGGIRYLELEETLETKIFASGSSTVQLSDVVVQGVTDDPAFGTFLVLFANPAFEFSANVNDTISRRSKYNGFGPKFGLDATLNLIGNLNITSNVTSSLLIGTSKNVYNETLENNSSATLQDLSLSVFFPGFDLIPFDITQVSPTTFSNTSSQRASISSHDETRVVPNIDAKIGFEYNYPFSNNCRKITIEAGYQISHYFNAFAQLDNQRVIPGISYQCDTSFNGPYIAMKVVI